jgi:hypothetical protein
MQVMAITYPVEKIISIPKEDLPFPIRCFSLKFFMRYAKKRGIREKLRRFLQNSLHSSNSVPLSDLSKSGGGGRDFRWIRDQA